MAAASSPGGASRLSAHTEESDPCPVPRLSSTLGIAIVAQLAIFLISLPGLGVETRKPSDYAAWAGPMFLILTILVFVLGLAAFALWRRRPWGARNLAMGQAAAAVATNLLDISHVGGPAPPMGPLVLGLLSIVVAVVAIYEASRCPVEPAPSG